MALSPPAAPGRTHAASAPRPPVSAARRCWCWPFALRRESRAQAVYRDVEVLPKGEVAEEPPGDGETSVTQVRPQPHNWCSSCSAMHLLSFIPPSHLLQAAVPAPPARPGCARAALGLASSLCWCAQATANLATTIIGAGIMALPCAFATLGIVLGTTTLALIYSLSFFSLGALIRRARRCGCLVLPTRPLPAAGAASCPQVSDSPCWALSFALPRYQRPALGPKQPRGCATGDRARPLRPPVPAGCRSCRSAGPTRELWRRSLGAAGRCRCNGRSSSIMPARWLFISSFSASSSLGCRPTCALRCCDRAALLRPGAALRCIACLPACLRCAALRCAAFPAPGLAAHFG